MGWPRLGTTISHETSITQTGQQDIVIRLAFRLGKDRERLEKGDLHPPLRHSTQVSRTVNLLRPHDLGILWILWILWEVVQGRACPLDRFLMRVQRLGGRSRPGVIGQRQNMAPR